ncbi:MAG: hypothetical protein K2P49_08995 [Oscillospiraceae bacterium]|nr:hypothetical protein [Oscillospiraceae bacterium]
MKKSISGRRPWLASALAVALAAAALRRWQLSTAFDWLGLAVPGAQSSVILVCLLLMAGAWFVILAVYQPVSKRPWSAGQAHRWDLVFLDSGDLVYPVLVVAAAFLAAASIPMLLPMGLDQWQAYQAAVKAHLQPPSNNGVLTLATAVGALLAFLGLLQMGRDGLHPGRRGKGGFSAALPGVAGCVWLMESFRAHAADPVLWDYTPLLLAIACGMLFYMDFAGMSAGAARPRRLLWMAAMAAALSAVALVTAWMEGSWADVLLLLSQTIAAAAVLWRLPPNLENPPKLNGTPLPADGGEASIQEETTHE